MTGFSPSSQVMLVARHALATSFRERTVALLSVLFLLLVVVSAYLGWSATTTVNAIYHRASEVMAAQGQTIPSNPVLDTSPLALLRNMATYVSLIGSLAAIVVGYQLIAGDRKAGIVPLIGSRPIESVAYGLGKAGALIASVVGLVVFAALINIATFAILPEFHLGAMGWVRLTGFYGVSVLYMLVFGFLGVIFAARAKSETVGLLVPVTIWLVLTFVLPQLTSNINPVAALNPVSALAAPPTEQFFQITGWALSPFSLAESYRILSAQLLEFIPPTYVVRAAIPPLASLFIAILGLGTAGVLAASRMDMSKGDYNA